MTATFAFSGGNAANGEPKPWLVGFTPDDVPGLVVIDFGDGSPPETHAGTGSVSGSHTYNGPRRATYRVAVTCDGVTANYPVTVV